MEMGEKGMVGGGREMRFRESVRLSSPLLPTDSKRYLIQADHSAASLEHPPILIIFPFRRGDFTEKMRENTII